jgi:hypothetical protein
MAARTCRRSQLLVVLTRSEIPGVGKDRLWESNVALRCEGRAGHLAPVRVNDALTLDFDDAIQFNSRHP